MVHPWTSSESTRFKLDSHPRSLSWLVASAAASWIPRVHCPSQHSCRQSPKSVYDAAHKGAREHVHSQPEANMMRRRFAAVVQRAAL